MQWQVTILALLGPFVSFVSEVSCWAEKSSRYSFCLLLLLGKPLPLLHCPLDFHHDTTSASMDLLNSIVYLLIWKRYAYTQTRLLSLPIPQAISLLTVLLPLFIGLSTRFIQLLLHPKTSPITRSPARPTLAILGILALQLIYETVLVTLLFTYGLPSELVTCGLERQWKHLYSSKNERRIRTVQDAFQCCGFRVSRDMPFPFPSKTVDVGECKRRLGSDKSCEASWRGAEQRNAGLLLLVALVVFILKVSAAWRMTLWRNHLLMISGRGCIGYFR